MKSYLAGSLNLIGAQPLIDLAANYLHLRIDDLWVFHRSSQA